MTQTTSAQNPDILPIREDPRTNSARNGTGNDNHFVSEGACISENWVDNLITRKIQLPNLKTGIIFASHVSENQQTDCLLWKMYIKFNYALQQN